MNTSIEGKVIDLLRKLKEQEQLSVLDFIQTLIKSNKKEGQPTNPLVKWAGSIDDQSAQEMLLAIKDFDVIDKDEW